MTEEATKGSQETTAEAGNNSETQETEGKTFTQADVDRIVGDRLKRERKDWESKVEEERRKAVMTEAERLQTERSEAEEKAKSAIESANRRVVEAELKAHASAAGIKAERLDYVLKLADLSGIAVTDDGRPDSTAVRAAVSMVTRDFPEIVSGGRMPKVGGDFSKPNPGETPLSDEAIGRMSNTELKRRLPEIRAFYARK